MEEEGIRTGKGQGEREYKERGLEVWEKSKGAGKREQERKGGFFKPPSNLWNVFECVFAHHTVQALLL